MKCKDHISSNFKWILILGMGLGMYACELKKEPEQKSPIKIKPVENSPIKINTDEIVKPIPIIDTITPTDSLRYQIKDTTETLDQIEKKPEKKVYKKLYLYSLYKKPLIS